MSSQWENILAAVTILTWAIGFIVLGVRANAIGHEFLRRLPPVDGATLNMYAYVGWFRGWRGPVWRAWRQPQPDPELERLRREGWRRSRHILLWLFGFPPLAFAIIVLLGVTGLLHVTH